MLYQIDWADDERTGEKFAPTWEPKKNLTEAALADWEALKLSRQASMSHNPRSIQLCLQRAFQQKFVPIVILQLTHDRTTGIIKQPCTQTTSNTCQSTRKAQQNSKSRV